MKVVLIGTVASSMFGFRMPLIKALLNRNCQVVAFAMNYTEQQKEDLIKLGVTPVDYSLSRSGLNPLADLKTMLFLKRKLTQIAPDVVLSYFAKPVIYGTLAAALAKVPHRVAMLEGLGFTFTDQPAGLNFKTKLIRGVQVALYKLSLPFANRVVFLNPDDPVDLITRYNIKTQKVDVLGGIGVDLQDYPVHDFNQGPVRFIFIARLLAEKGVYEYLKAARITKRKYPDAEFVVLGGFDESNSGGLKQAELNGFIEDGSVIYPGHVDNVNEWLIDASVFALPSYYREGVPRSTQEAMAIGRPILTTDVPGCRETVVEGENGFFVPPWSPEQLAEKMMWFIEHPDQIETMGKASRRIAEERFDVHKVNVKMLKIMGIENNETSL
ncbi:glycosyltransferase family 4 protein [Marinomonas algarum]|uniref:Glycosyltransferase family 4 protein n=1 Tax=Marinomonas algarum TaxID=2883105 RepID=A0A9X1ILL7_9GAMM|nr:glycosyltransferase family 4 protein [Marinomonas algarum]MCB5161508.1 glycosyltransferase family 4 protein [Marinomonas algarum]